jgi:aminoglycoside 3-N-acetyltransferase
MPSRLEQLIRATDRPATVRSLARDLAALGLTPGMTLAVHSSLSALGFVVGGPVAVILALEDALAASGTLAMPTHTVDLCDPGEWENPAVPSAWHEPMRADFPAFDPALSPTFGMGWIPECFRKQAGTRRSHHPLVSWAARGPNAAAITSGHELRMAQGEGSPLARLYELDAHVLLLGVDFNHNTSCHLAEYRSQHAAQHPIRARAAVSVEGRSSWVSYDDIEWNDEDFLTLGLDFERESDLVRIARVAGARAKLFPLRPCVDFAVAWMNRYRAKENRRARCNAPPARDTP